MPQVGTSTYLVSVVSELYLTGLGVFSACFSHHRRACHLRAVALFPLHCPVNQPDPLPKPVRIPPIPLLIIYKNKPRTPAFGLGSHRQ